MNLAIEQTGSDMSAKNKQIAECQWCGTVTDLTLFENGTNRPEWLCCYCSCHFDNGNLILKSISCMLHTLENRIKKT